MNLSVNGGMSATTPGDIPVSCARDTAKTDLPHGTMTPSKRYVVTRLKSRAHPLHDDRAPVAMLVDETTFNFEGQHVQNH